jgi:hypothetical protein
LPRGDLFDGIDNYNLQSVICHRDALARTGSASGSASRVRKIIKSTPQILTSFLAPSGDIYRRGKQGPTPSKELGWETEKPSGRDRRISMNLRRLGRL